MKYLTDTNGHDQWPHAGLPLPLNTTTTTTTTNNHGPYCDAVIYDHLCCLFLCRPCSLSPACPNFFVFSLLLLLPLFLLSPS